MIAESAKVMPRRRLTVQSALSSSFIANSAGEAGIQVRDIFAVFIDEVEIKDGLSAGRTLNHLGTQHCRGNRYYALVAYLSSAIHSPESWITVIEYTPLVVIEVSITNKFISSRRSIWYMHNIHFSSYELYGFFPSNLDNFGFSHSVSSYYQHDNYDYYEK
jgi:hypothetical protein